MKKFLSRLILFIVIMFIIGLIKLALSPNSNYSYAFLNAKLEFLEKHPEYNMYFIGSSKINDQIDCKVIDQNIKGVKSYNLGANAGFDLENFQTLDFILNNKNFKPKYIVVELQDKIKVTKTNIKTERSFGAFNYDNTAFAVKYHKENKDYKQIGLSLVSFVLNVFHFNKYFDEKDIQKADNNFVSKNQGFSPLEFSVVPRTEENKLRAIIKDRLERYHADHNKYQPNKALVNKINELAERCKKKNIQLIMLVPGPAEPDAKKLEVYQNVLKVPLVSLVNPDEYTEFYLYENRWDTGHLNSKGSKILSEKTALHLEKILDKKQ
ncbi:hypothetical protein [Chryseobacterium sp. G0201]|uniref:hypothetical protein n=1 Tax=Chryseobacterium sp. G0201 TaxID=2487065 RepID=UPI000F4E3CF3|nr:hypothetical protein [Chryseobacterium sp. G0201]